MRRRFLDGGRLIGQMMVIECSSSCKYRDYEEEVIERGK